MEIVYPCKNTRKCYWLCRECLKGHSHRCSPKCPDYLSIARVKTMPKIVMISRILLAVYYQGSEVQILRPYFLCHLRGEVVSIKPLDRVTKLPRF